LRWRAAPPEHLTWAEFSGDFLVYHRPSGKTHLVNATAASLLQQVLVEPLSLEEATGRLAQALDAPADAELLTHVADLLARLDEIGLVERVDD
jgi:PqqD family protein of HPr-rel-A system